MTSEFKLTVTFFLLLFIVSTGFSQEKSSYDRSIDFTEFETYHFVGWNKDSDKILNDFDKKRVIEALKEEFKARGMSLVQSGEDVSITLFVVVDQEASPVAYAAFNGLYGYKGQWGWGIDPGTGVANTTYVQDDYQEGTLVIDMYTASKKLIWQGIITSGVKENVEEGEKSISRKVRRLMNAYPVEPKN